MKTLQAPGKISKPNIYSARIDAENTPVSYLTKIKSSPKNPLSARLFCPTTHFL